jgi:hypothetical protein
LPALNVCSQFVPSNEAPLPADLVAELRTMARELSKIVVGPLEENTAWRGADEIMRLRRGEFICSKCGLRKDGEKPNVEF